MDFRVARQGIHDYERCCDPHAPPAQRLGITQSELQSENASKTRIILERRGEAETVEMRALFCSIVWRDVLELCALC